MVFSLRGEPSTATRIRSNITAPSTAGTAAATSCGRTRAKYATATANPIPNGAP